VERGGSKTLIDEVYLRNFRSHKKTHISFEYDEGENITVVIGVNGSGKTSILDGISFALFKGKPAGVGVAELITLGEDEGEVSLTFHSNGRKYRVRRKRSVKGGAESFFYQLNKSEEKLVAMREKEVTKEIEDVLGINGELFTNAVYIKQGEIDRLFTDDEAKRKMHIGKLIGIDDIENAYRNFFHLLNHYELKIEKLEGVPDVLEEKKEIREKEADEVKALKSELKGLEEKLGSEKRTVQRLEKRIEIFDVLRLKVEEEKNLSKELFYLREKIKKIDDFEEQLKSTEVAKKRADLIEKKVEDLKEKVSELKVVAERKSRNESEFKVEKDKRDSLRKEIEDILSYCSSILKITISDITVLESEKNKAVKALETEIKTIEKKKEKTLKMLAEKKALLDSIKKALTEISESKGACPVCGQKLNRDHRENLIKTHSREIESLKKTITDDSAALENFRDESKQLEKRKESIDSLNTDVYKEKKRLLEEREKKIFLLEERVNEDESALKDLLPLVDKKDSLEKELSVLLPSRDHYNAALNFLRKEHPEKEVAESKIKGLEKKIGAIRKEISFAAEKVKIDIALLLPSYEGLKDELKSAQQSLIELREKVASDRSTLKHKETRINELEKEISALEAQVRERRALKDFKSLLERIRSVFHKDKLQKELRIRARPLIEEYTREVFLSFNLPYSDVTLTDDYSITVHGANGEESVDMLSGGERIAAALALRVGLSRALSGQRLELLILDEPTIHLDVYRRRELVDIIKNLSLIPQTIVVTHDKEFEEAADRIIEVEKVNGVSVVR
jgi:exonuclease SbcC